MNKQFVAAMTSVAMLASSCVSTQKYDTRGIASSQSIPAPSVVGKIADIAAQGVEQVEGPAQQEIIALRKGRTFNFESKKFRPSEFTNSDVQKLASAYNIKLAAGQVLVDNDLAFQRKLDVIQSAKNELRMVYFIYSDDHSSSVLNAALLKKAQEGVKVKLMVDFITNYKNLDLFIALNTLSKGNIQPYFYNFPNQQIFADATYMSLPCSKNAPNAKVEHDACYQEKMAKLAQMGTPAQLKANPPAMAKLLLTGIYAKNPAALKVAIGMGAQINPADYKNKNTPPPSQDELESLLDLAVIFKEAFVDNSIIAKIKLSIAMSMYGEKINPILNELSGRFPLRSLGAYGASKGDGSRSDVWDHFTDYTHHKLVLADGEQFVLGGRNIEDSYHMKYRVGSEGKYIFTDTDFWGHAKDNSAYGIAKAFDAIVKSPMVASLATAKTYLAYDFVANTAAKGSKEPGATEMAVQTCMQQGAGDKLGECILNNLHKMRGYKTEEERVQVVMDEVKKGMDDFKKYKPRVNNAFIELSQNDLNKGSFYYLENTNVKGAARIAGSLVGFEADHKKNIQAAWYRGLENVCKVSQSENRDMRVVFNTAYLLMPSGMIHRLAQMMNNDFGDCSRVTVTFITNSPYTTDLAPINVLARYQLGALFDHYKSLQKYKETFEAPVTLEGAGEDARYIPATASTPANKIVRFKYKQFWPKFEYYEYRPAEMDELVRDYVSQGKKPNSLHTKTSLLGDDLIIGSANADVRSYYMDTNNALLIRNAQDMNAQYIEFIEKLKSSGQIVDRMGYFQGRSFEALRAENEEFLQKFAQRWNQEKRLDTGYAKKILEYVDKGGQKIYTTTRDLLTYRAKFNDKSMVEVSSEEIYKYNEQLNKDANRFDDLFKLF